MNPYTMAPDLNGEGRTSVCGGEIQRGIGMAELDACLSQLGELGLTNAMSWLCRYPVRSKLGVTLAQMAETFEFDALIALGAVIRAKPTT